MTGIGAVGISRIILLSVLLLSIAYAIPGQFSSRSASPLSANFTYKPLFILAGDQVTFTENVTGGTPPYAKFGWNFGDGSPSIFTTTNSTIHAFVTPGTFTVTMNVTDFASLVDTKSKPVTANEWPVSLATAFGWVIPWNITNDDGINIHDVTFHGTIIIADARLTAVQVVYLHNICGPFFDEAVGTDMAGVKADGNISYYQNFTNPTNPYFQLSSEYRVPGYAYTEAFRFYKDGTWEIIQTIARGGCAVIKTYEPHWRIDLALNEQANNYMSTFTRQGTWQDLLWEENLTDSGFRDPAHNSTIWRWGDQGRYYYFVPREVRADLDLPDVPGDVILVRNRPNEIETPCPECGKLESPVEWVNGELAFHRDIAFWWVPKVYDHGLVSGLSPTLKVVSLTFYPGVT